MVKVVQITFFVTITVGSKLKISEAELSRQGAMEQEGSKQCVEDGRCFFAIFWLFRICLLPEWAEKA